MEILTKPQTQLSLIDQVDLDLRAYLSKSRNFQNGVRLLAQKSGLHVKTIDRLLQKKNKPSYQTLYKLYCVFLNVTTIDQMKLLSPAVIGDEIDRMNPNRSHKISYSPNAESELQQNDTALLIYAILGSGPLSETVIRKKFGEFGFISLQKLMDLNLVEESPQGNFKATSTQVNLTPKLLLRISQLFIQHFFRSESADFKSENYIAVLSESVSDQAYAQILALDRAHFEEKLKIIDRPENRGENRIFSVQISEKMQVLNDDNDLDS